MLIIRSKLMLLDSVGGEVRVTGSHHYSLFSYHMH